MDLNRRHLLTAAGACLASCATGTKRSHGERAVPERSSDPLDQLFAAHANTLPENVGGGANHYPMAGEALVALGQEAAIPEVWRTDAPRYAGTLPRVAPIASAGQEWGEALGDYGRFGDWLDLFHAELARDDWRNVLRRWTPRLAPGISAGVLHGVIRTAHAVRALRTRDTPARRNELAAGLAYWAACFVQLPVGRPHVPSDRTLETLQRLEHPWKDDSTPVPFEFVVDRLTAEPLAPAVHIEEARRSRQAPREALAELAHAAALGFLEMLVLERHRVWMLHTVTAPAAVDLLLPEVDLETGHRLVEYTRQSVVAMYAAFAEPFTAGAHVRSDLPEWNDSIERAAANPTVHTVKLIEAIQRFDRGDDAPRHGGDPVWRSIAAQWFEWT